MYGHKFRLSAATAILTWSIGVAAQHAGHQPAPASSGVSAEVVAACADAQRQTLALVDAANGRLELARQTNEPGAMRAAMDDLQTTLSMVKTQLAGCAQLAADPAADPHAGHTPPSVRETPAQAPDMPVMQPESTHPATGGEKRPDYAATDRGGAPESGATKDAGGPDRAKGAPRLPVLPVQDGAIDPVCGKKVDPKTAPQAKHGGRTYYFCSEDDKKKFLKDPGRYRVTQP